MFVMSSTDLKMNRFAIGIFALCFWHSGALAQPGIGSDFLDVASSRVAAVGGSSQGTGVPRIEFKKVCPFENNSAARKILLEYGAMFVVSDKIIPPPTCRFQNDAQVAAFQAKLKTSVVPIDGNMIRLQQAAAESLNAVIVNALSQGFTVRALDGDIAGGRNYSDTVRLWNSRFEPALRFWVARNRIPADQANSFGQLPLDQQIEKVIDWESQGMRFGTGRGSSIFASTAPPGASQHLALVAIDIASPLTLALVALMNSHGWFQTVKGDRPHFTYLGLTEKELPGRGLKALDLGGTRYWVPNISSDAVPNP